MNNRSKIRVYDGVAGAVLQTRIDFELSMGWATARLGNGLGIYETWIEAVVVAETAGDCGWRWR